MSSSTSANASSPAELKAEILRLTREYSALMHQANRPAPEIAPISRAGVVLSQPPISTAPSIG